MGARLQELRQQKGLSQSQLARAAGVPVGSLKNWEQGKRHLQLSTACQLARALGITVDELAGQVFAGGPSGEKKPAAKGRGKKAKGE